MRRLSRAFLTGLAAVLPIVITIAVLVWIGSAADSLLKPLFTEKFYRPGMGLIAGVALIMAIGILLQAYVFQRLFAHVEKWLNRVPVVSMVYSSVHDLVEFFSESKDKTTSQVVTVKLGGTNLRLIGFVTREDFSACPKGLADEGTIAVYLPMSYQMGGFTAMLPRSCVQPIDMSFQDAMRFALTAGMASGEKSIILPSEDKS